MKIEASDLRVQYRDDTPDLRARVSLSIDLGDEWGALTVFDCEVHVRADGRVFVEFPITATSNPGQDARPVRALSWTATEKAAEFQREALLAIEKIGGLDG